jgi:hypothetical protein
MHAPISLPPKRLDTLSISKRRSLPVSAGNFAQAVEFVEILGDKKLAHAKFGPKAVLNPSNSITPSQINCKVDISRYLPCKTLEPVWVA